MPEWEPEVQVDEARARGLIEGQFPELRGAPIQEVGAGWDNVIATFLAAALLSYADAEGMAGLRTESLVALDRVVA